jgi:hypothetical protein
MQSAILQGIHEVRELRAFKPKNALIGQPTQESPDEGCPQGRTTRSTNRCTPTLRAVRQHFVALAFPEGNAARTAIKRFPEDLCFDTSLPFRPLFPNVGQVTRPERKPPWLRPHVPKHAAQFGGFHRLRR